MPFRRGTVTLPPSHCRRPPFINFGVKIVFTGGCQPMTTVYWGLVIGCSNQNIITCTLKAGVHYPLYPLSEGSEWAGRWQKEAKYSITPFCSSGLTGDNEWANWWHIVNTSFMTTLLSSAKNILYRQYNMFAKIAIYKWRNLTVSYESYCPFLIFFAFISPFNSKCFYIHKNIYFRHTTSENIEHYCYLQCFSSSKPSL